MKKYLITFLTIIIIFMQTGCNSKTDTFSAEDYSLGTIVKLTIYDNIPTDKCNQISKKVFDRLKDIEERMTINKIGSNKSEIIHLNSLSGLKAVKLSPDTFYVIEKGLEYSKLSSGLFDITIGPVVKLWNIGTSTAAVPKPNTLRKALNLVDYNSLIIDKSAGTAKLLKKNMKVDLGAVAKGYAADEAVNILSENGVKHAIINLGGNIRVMGSKPDGKDWSIGIQNPDEPNGKYVGIIKVNNKTIVTSGIYERFFIEKGIKYHHILDTNIGYPVENELASVSIITRLSVNADCLSTTVFAMGLEKGMELVDELEDVEAVFITKDKRIITSQGLTGKFNLTNDNYRIE